MRRLALLIALALVSASCSADSADDTTVAGASLNDELTQPPFDYSVIDYDRAAVGSALRGDRRDPAYPPAVVDPSDIVSGGPPPDGIPPIDDPVFASIADVDFIGGANEGVVVVEINGEAKAYPIQILIWHEIVNDEIGGVPVTVTYCPLCNSALVFDRRFGDRVLDFGTSGALYQSALVMYDRQTESLWAHFTGQGLVGHYAGAQLELIPAQTLGYESFVDAFPEGVVLTPDTGFNRRYGENPYVGYDDASTDPIGGFISQTIDDRFSAKDRVVGVIDRDNTYGVLLEELTEAAVVEITGADRNLVVLHQAGLNSSLQTGAIAGGRDVGQTGVFVAVAGDGRDLSFEAAGAGFVDAETGSSWSVLGRAIDGPLAGEQLESVPHVDTFWFSWSTYQPDHILITP